MVTAQQFVICTLVHSIALTVETSLPHDVDSNLVYRFLLLLIFVLRNKLNQPSTGLLSADYQLLKLPKARLKVSARVQLCSIANKPNISNFNDHCNR